MNEIDKELESYIESTIAESNGDYITALGKVIEWMKQNRELKGFHIGTPLDALEANSVAKDVLNMFLEYARGRLKEVTNEELEAM